MQRHNVTVGELVYTTPELRRLNTIGGPVCIEHDRKIGRVGMTRSATLSPLVI